MDIYNYSKIILQKGIPDRNRLSRFKINAIHNSFLLGNISTAFEGKNSGKPYGIWYSLKWYWINNMQLAYHYHDIDYSVDPEREYRFNASFFLYDVKINDNAFVYLGGRKGLNKILVLRDKKDTEIFYDLYKKMPEDASWQYIDWKKVYVDYGGLEVRMSPMTGYFKFGTYDKVWWWFGWDVASGCIWNGDLIESTKWIL